MWFKYICTYCQKQCHVGLIFSRNYAENDYIYNFLSKKNLSIGSSFRMNSAVYAAIRQDLIKKGGPSSY